VRGYDSSVRRIRSEGKRSLAHVRRNPFRARRTRISFIVFFIILSRFRNGRVGGDAPAGV